MLQSYQVSENARNDFNFRLKKFTSLIKTYFVILAYLERHLAN
jgi:hypothetical protein